MRKLLYVPILHTEPDLGKAGPALERRSAALCGEKRWARHKAAVSEFWQRVADYFRDIEATRLKIYQDGLVAEGELGRRIVTEGAARGSKNYEILLDLIKRGAEIRATESAPLLQEEYEDLLRQAKSPPQTPSVDEEYAERKARRSRERDRFVARRINQTLREGEVGILFLGAYHDVLSHLAGDIAVEKLKEPDKIKAYFKELLEGRSEGRFEPLACYLSSPIAGPR